MSVARIISNKKNTKLFKISIQGKPLLINKGHNLNIEEYKKSTFWHKSLLKIDINFSNLGKSLKKIGIIFISK